MIDFSKCKISFVALAPPNDVLTHFFQAPSDTPEAIFLKQIVTYRPHPAMQAVWVKFELNGKNIGLATLYLPPQQAPLEAPVFIGNFVIDKEWRRHRLGHFLLKNLSDYCKTRRRSRLTLQFSAHSLRFWQANGFERSIAFPKLLFKTI